jgi:hypothetical protein
MRQPEHRNGAAVDPAPKCARSFGLRCLAAIVTIGVPSLAPAASEFQPTAPALLTAGSPTKDEDPSVLLARDGSLFVAWFSDRLANPDIYITRTTDGVTWQSPIRVTDDVNGDFAPSLIQDEDGIFHLVWFRWDTPFHGHIWTNSSSDGIHWDPATESPVTTEPDVDDWVPSLAQAAHGSLLVCFASQKRSASSTRDLYVTTRGPGQMTWSQPVPVPGVNSPTENDDLPFLARTSRGLTLVWMRFDTSQPTPWLNPRSDLFLSTSSDGLAWAPPSQVTHEGPVVANLFPELFPGADESWSILWLSTRSDPPALLQLPERYAAVYPAGVVQNDMLPAGYSHRISPTSTPEVFLGVWVQGPEGAQDLYYRFFRMPPPAVVGVAERRTLAFVLLTATMLCLAARQLARRHRRRGAAPSSALAAVRS